MLTETTSLLDPSQDANLIQGYLTPESTLLSHYTASWLINSTWSKICVKFQQANSIYL